MLPEHTLNERRWRGIAAAPGIALGAAFVYRVAAEGPPPRSLGPDADLDAECRRLDEALAAVHGDLVALKAAAPGSVGSALSKIFDAQVLILDDAAIRAQVREMILRERTPAENAFFAVVSWAQQEIMRSKDLYLREMANDIEAVKSRVVHCLLGLPAPHDHTLTAPAVILAHTITPADIMSLQQGLVLGIVAETGGQTSHTALLAKSLGIPAVVGVGVDVRLVRPGTQVVVDGYSGVVIIEPHADTVEFFERKKAHTRSPWPKRLEAFRELPAQTRDRHTVKIMANIDLAAETELSLAAGAGGIGLYRTEYLYLQHGQYPTETKQRAIYRRVAQALQGRPLVVRTFDLGFDKASPHATPDPNPALGMRGIRLALETPRHLIGQFHALLAASADGPIWVMVPMISGVEEFATVQRLWREAKAALSRRRIRYDRKSKLGLMIETPAAVQMAPELARQADFFSIGTNDLVQYTTAVDRGNSRLKRLQHYWHPSLWRQIATVIKAGHRAKIPVGVCGEMAGDPLTIAPFVGLGIDSVSIHPNSIPSIKALIRSLSYTDSKQVARRVIACATADDLQEIVKDFYRRTQSRARSQKPSRRKS
ncbi:MAG: phosphoenolpyruvate--protein phosphotransferase [candidate division Zixibacteria bacterium]|nr:phosphoenolpyruvate--protein phosphotransferase [candidate division Zixibacteria bacterium]